MSGQNDYSKMLMAGVAGGLAGLMLGVYLMGKDEGDSPISKKLKSLAGAIEQLEKINSDEANNLKEELTSLIHNLNVKYGKSEE